VEVIRCTGVSKVQSSMFGLTEGSGLAEPQHMLASLAIPLYTGFPLVLLSHCAFDPIQIYLL
jgi:hypothetical protein